LAGHGGLAFNAFTIIVLGKHIWDRATAWFAMGWAENTQLGNASKGYTLPCASLWIHFQDILYKV